MAMMKRNSLLLLDNFRSLAVAHTGPWQHRLPAFTSQKTFKKALMRDHLLHQVPWHTLQVNTLHSPRLLSNGSSQNPPHASISSSSQGDTWPTNLLSQHDTRQQSLILAKLVSPFNGSSMCVPSSTPPQGRLDKDKENNDVMALHKTRRLLRLVQLKVVKRRLQLERHGIMPYTDLLKVCKKIGVASSLKDAAHFAKSLDDAGIIFIFQDLVYLNPKEVAQLVLNAIPKPLSTREQQCILQEVSHLEEEKEEIDRLAHDHSRKVLWSGLGYLTLQTAFIFRFTFWDLSWDVMEPIAYFFTTFSLLVGYAFFMVTSKDPTYQDLAKTLLSSKQQKLMKKRNFDMGRLLELQRKCHPSTSTFSWQKKSLNDPFTIHSYNT